MNKYKKRITPKYLMYSSLVNTLALSIIMYLDKFNVMSLFILIVVNFTFDILWEKFNYDK